MLLANRSAAITICYLILSCTAIKKGGTENSLLDPAVLHPYGRFTINKKNEIQLIGSGVHFGFSFEGSQCKIQAYIQGSTGHNYIQYELDGIYQRRIKISANDPPLVIKAQTKGKHTIWIYKATEAQTGPIYVGYISGKNVKPLLNSPAPLIEFIGNSITCGAGADTSEIPCGSGEYYDQHNAYLSYGPRVARSLGVNFILSSVSGIGIYRNWNNNGPTMPDVYEFSNLQNKNDQNWDFSKYTPRIVSIALGTNDFSKGDGIRKRAPFDSIQFVQNYIKFIRLVKTKYPLAQIALLSSPIFNGDNKILLENCITAVKQNIDALYPTDKRIALFFFPSLKGRGCTGHPNVEDHAILANELLPFFKMML